MLRIPQASLAIAVCFSTLISLSSCVSIQRDAPAPAPHNYTQAQIQGFEQIRFWGDEIPPYLNAMIAHQQRALAANPAFNERLDIVALSGGGSDGAYGAGFMKGWTDRGDRPTFFMVTGISTGALMAPFVFLGADYDAVLRRFYTQTQTRQIATPRILKGLLGGDAFASTAPLEQLLNQVVTPDVVAQIAAESRKGRLLFIGTTNLDAQRPVIWDIGRIAESGNPQAAQLIRHIMLASASVPGGFPPARFTVTIDGKTAQEAHVDGGITQQIFVYPPSLHLSDLAEHIEHVPQKNLWLVRNTKLNPEYEAVKLTVPAIGTRSVQTLIKYQGLADLYAIEGVAQRDNFNIHLTTVPASFRLRSKKVFDPKYMSALYDLGYKTALSDSQWHSNNPQTELTLHSLYR
jgi:hypothetical protein